MPGSRAGTIRRACRDQGVAVYPVAPYYDTPPERTGFVLGYASLREDVIDKGVSAIATAMAAEV